MELDIAIVNQVEFYFSDINLRKDRYLRSKIEENGDGFVKISELLTFNKLKALTQDQNTVVQALRKSTKLAINGSGDSIRRSVPFQKAEAPVDVSVFINGLPVNCNQDDIILALKSMNDLEPLLIKLRKEQNCFNGDAFVEFANAAQAKYCVENASKELKVRGTDSLLPNLKVTLMRDWLLLQKQTDVIIDDGGNNNNSSSKNNNTKKPESQDEIMKGSFLVLTGLQEDCTRELIREIIKVRIAYVDFERGSTKAILRFPSVEECQKGMENLKQEPDKLKVNDISILQGQEEEDYIKAITEKRNKRRENTTTTTTTRNNSQKKRKQNDHHNNKRNNNKRGRN